MKRYELGLCSIILFSTLFVEIRIVVTTNGGESSLETRTVTRYESITKRTNDKRSYRGLKLTNDLKILLVSDPTSSRASATMTIGVGSLNDPDELPGMAHLMGEMLNRSSSSVNPEYEFADVVNSELSVTVELPIKFPTTEEDHQIFYFNIDANHLRPTLEIFARIFYEPLFLTSNARNQLVTSINHLDWTYSTTLLNEMGNKWRFLQLEKSISAESHPFNCSPYGTRTMYAQYAKIHGVPFSPILEEIFILWEFELRKFHRDRETFNKYLVEAEVSDQSDTLEPRPTILHNKLREFYSQWYSSNIMCLVVLGRETLDELEQVTVPLFEDIQNRYAEKLNFSYEQHPWGQEQLRRKIYSVSDSEFLHDEILRLVFRVPDIRHQYKTAPDLYVTEFLMRGGPGSLISVLEKRKLCDYIKARYDVKAGIGFFSIKCEVPWNCEMQEDEIVSLILQYIRFLRKDGIQEWIFKENKVRHNSSSRTSFPYGNNVKYIARALQVYPLEDILIYRHHQDEWKQSLIEDFLTYLIPDNMNIFIDSRKFQGIIEEQNKWHKIPYDIEIIPEHLLEKWKTTDISSDFQIAQPNEFLATNWVLHPLKKNEPENPEIIRTTPGSRFWFSQDNQSTHVRIRFTLTSVKRYQDPSNSTFLCILCHLLRHLMDEYAYALEVSGYGWSFISSASFIEVRLEGYADKIQIALKKIMSKINADQLVGGHLLEPFEKAKLKCIDKEKNRRKHPTALHRLEYVLTEAAENWSSDEIIAVSQSLQLKDWEKFIRKMLSRVFIQGLIFGNCVKKSALNIARIIEAPFEPTEKWMRFSGELPNLFPRMVEIEGGRHFVDVLFRETESQPHVHVTYYQLGVGTNQNTIKSTLILYMIRSKCNILDQNGIFKLHNVIGLLVSIINAHVHRPEDTETVFESCLKKIHIMLQEMGVAEFEEYVKLLVDDELSDMLRVETYWNDITRGLNDYLRDRGALDESTRLITKQDVLMFFEDKLYEQSLNRRKYTILIFPANSEGLASSSDFVPEAVKIEDVMTFRNDSNLLSLPVPSI